MTTEPEQLAAILSNRPTRTSQTADTTSNSGSNLATSCTTNKWGWHRKPPAGYEGLTERASYEPVKRVLQNNRWPVYLWGEVGVGKSCLAALAYCRFSGHARMVRWPDFAKDAMALEKSPEITRWVDGVCSEISVTSFWRVAEESQLFILDEIGIGGDNATIRGWRTEILWRLLEGRKHKPTILTGNVPPLKLAESFDNRIQDRICEGQMVEIKGTSERMQGVRGRFVVVEAKGVAK